MSSWVTRAKCLGVSWTWFVYVLELAGDENNRKQL